MLDVKISDRQMLVSRFVLSGGSAALTQFTLLYALTEYVRLWYLASSIISYAVGFLVSFILQKWWTFRNRSREEFSRQFVLYLGVFFCGLCANAVLLYLLVEKAHVWYIVAQVITSACIAFVNFFLYRSIFRYTTVVQEE